MPLMQLSTLVLPAPFGPISANSSPGATENDTSSSTVSPPKRRLRRATSSSAIPPPRPAILLHRPVRASLTARLAEVEFLHVLVAFEPLAVAIEHYAAVLHHVGMVGDRQRGGRTLLDEQDGDAELVADREQAPREVLHDDGRKPERQLVDEQQARPAHERAGNRQHLPFAAGEQPADAVAQLGEPREQLVDLLVLAPAFRRAQRARNRHRQVF